MLEKFNVDSVLDTIPDSFTEASTKGCAVVNFGRLGSLPVFFAAFLQPLSVSTSESSVVALFYASQASSISF